jgi:hypothetical protein
MTRAIGPSSIARASKTHGEARPVFAFATAARGQGEGSQRPRHDVIAGRLTATLLWR